MPTPTPIQEEYQEVDPAVVEGSKAVVDMWNHLGRPKTPFTESGKKLMNVIIAVWEDLYPLEAHMWYEERKNYQEAELSVSDQVKRHTGRSLASYPFAVYQLSLKVFKGFDPAERKNCLKMVKMWPMFRFTNKV